jgi:hypothetical protein
VISKFPCCMISPVPYYHASEAGRASGAGNVGGAGGGGVGARTSPVSRPCASTALVLVLVLGLGPWSSSRTWSWSLVLVLFSHHVAFGAWRSTTFNTSSGERVLTQQKYESQHCSQGEHRESQHHGHVYFQRPSFGSHGGAVRRSGL